MKVFNTILKVFLVLLLVSPILDVLGILPSPTADMYNTPDAVTFIQALITAWYTNIIIALCIVLILTRRTALAALLLLPIMLNIVVFHTFLDGGLLTAGAMMANVLLLLLNLYFLWKNCDAYRQLCNWRS